MSSFAIGATEATITIISGTSGGNCGAPHGNVTQDIAQHCNGLHTCDYPLSTTAKPSGDCRGDYLAEWRCGSQEFHNARLDAIAGGGDRLVLSCVPPRGAGH
ncbi:hypothetical protein G3N58_21205 [Paraburkholderia sp. Ac-20342]|nr:hypothetical protein [Paraburkholderia sp. Ac-20342]